MNNNEKEEKPLSIFIEINLRDWEEVILNMERKAKFGS